MCKTSENRHLVSGDLRRLSVSDNYTFYLVCIPDVTFTNNFKQPGQL